ncbi:hypothetical protein [Legionella gratiana]|nr:hypothetical protein [Legionella gratiana]
MEIAMGLKKDEVIRVYFRGCYHKEIGNGVIFPEIENVASRIRNSFDKDQILDLEELRTTFGDGICRIEPKDCKKITATAIGLTGFSRGGVTALAVAQKVNDLNIPIDILPNQPVPGQAQEKSFRSLYSKYHDLTKCKNIRSATTLLATHNMENDILHNQFFSQMVAKFPKETKTKVLLMPHQDHGDSVHYSIAGNLTRWELHEMGYAKDFDHDRTYKDAQKLYERYNVCFTPEEFRQKIFGADNCSIIVKEPFYRRMIEEKAKEAYQTINESSETKKEEFPDNLNFEQLSAIAAVGNTQLEHEWKKKFINLILENNDSGKKFTQIVNKTEDVIQYLIATTKRIPKSPKDHPSCKSECIKKEALEYKAEIFKSSYAYLLNKTPTQQDQEKLLQEISLADQTFVDNALSINRNLSLKAMKVITNFILHVTGLFLLTNTVNFALTGNWFFFNKTRSEKLMNSTSEEIKELVQDGKEKFASQTFKDHLKESFLDENYTNRINPNLP